MLNKEEIENFIYSFNKYMSNQTEDEIMQTYWNIIHKYIEQLEHDNDIMQRSLTMQTKGWNEGARLFTERQRLIEKLEERRNKAREFLEEAKKQEDKIRRSSMGRTFK